MDGEFFYLASDVRQGSLTQGYACLSINDQKLAKLIKVAEINPTSMTQSFILKMKYKNKFKIIASQ